MTAALTADALAVVDRSFLASMARASVPGAAWGVVHGGELVHASGFGTTSTVDGHRPGAGTSFRIASMTKSFTAAAVLALRDEGRVRLDDPIATYVPELAGLRGPTTDAAAVTVRHLLSMDAGLASDDPWADRHLDIGADELGALFERGAWFAHAPGVALEYSNLGFAMLGRAVANVTGTSCQQAITTRLLQPLGLHDTVWERRATDTDVAQGHRLVDGEPEPETAPLGDGGIAPMGGLWSTVTDLARWVAFLLDAFPARDGHDEGPLRRSTRREMQRVWRASRLAIEQLDGHGGLRAGRAGYGFGLFLVDDLDTGVHVTHSGGLPGFGSNMRWIPDLGIGVVSLGNLTYAPMALANRTCLEALHAAQALPPAPAAVAPPALSRAVHDLVALLNDWSDEAATALFADNVALDEPLTRRAGAAAATLDEIGRLAVEDVKVLHRGGADVIARGEHGVAVIELSLHPGVPPLVQWYEVTTIRTPTDAQVRTNAALCALVRTDVTADDLDGLVHAPERHLVAAELVQPRLAWRLGKCNTHSAPGDAGRACFRWRGEHGDVDVTIAWLDDTAVASTLVIAFPARGAG